MHTLSIGKVKMSYVDSHDLAAIIEVIVMDIYGIRYLKKGDVVLDLGGGIGEFALLSSKAVGESGLVVSVEPNTDDFKLMTKNLAENDCKNVRSFNRAFSSKTCEVSLVFKGHKFQAETISVEELITCLADSKKRKFDIIKMDIEGAEKEAVELLKEYLNGVRSIMIELHGTKEDVDKILEPLGFKFRRLTKSDYIKKSLAFLIRHPITTLNILRLFNSSGENPGFKKILGGIEITASQELMVGRYERL
jgi:FkbM family methyltransferase